jgi:hypothetical protein
MKQIKLKFENENEHLHQEFKIMTVTNGTTMQEQLIKMIKEYLKENEVK